MGCLQWDIIARSVSEVVRTLPGRYNGMKRCVYLNTSLKTNYSLRFLHSKAVKVGNEEAPGRLAALRQTNANALSRSEHDKLAENELIRRHTQAKEKSETDAQKGEEVWLRSLMAMIV